MEKPKVLGLQTSSTCQSRSRKPTATHSHSPVAAIGLALPPQTLSITVFIVAHRTSSGSMLRNAKPLTAKQDTFTQRPATLLSISN